MRTISPGAMLPGSVITAVSASAVCSKACAGVMPKPRTPMSAWCGKCSHRAAMSQHLAAERRGDLGAQQRLLLALIARREMHGRDAADLRGTGQLAGLARGQVELAQS